MRLAGRKTLVLRYLLLFGLISITFSSILLLKSLAPNLYRDLMIAIDITGISEVARDEKQRIRTIENLGIPYEKREVLKNRTVFLGATEEMVLLALGKPSQIDKKADSTTWVYYFEADQRPTLLVFKGSVLSAAYRGSVLDIATQ